MYFSDVKLQYEAAHWAQLFNRANPPKKIIMIQCFVLEFFERPGSPVVGCERFVDGVSSTSEIPRTFTEITHIYPLLMVGHDKFGAGFVKHNSNAGYVEAHEQRLTPQAFSYFSFYASHGEIMVVDIQGVSDIYTDPQVRNQTHIPLLPFIQPQSSHWPDCIDCPDSLCRSEPWRCRPWTPRNGFILRNFPPQPHLRLSAPSPLSLEQYRVSSQQEGP